MTISEYTQIFALPFVSISALLAIRTFNRNKKQELENHLYKIRLDALSNIAFELDNFFIILSRGIIQLQIISTNSIQSDVSNKLEELSSNVDEQIFKCHSMIVKYSVYFTEESTQNLLNFTNNLLGETENDGDSLQTILEWANKYYDSQLILSNKSIDALREELHLEKIHSTLYKRLK